MSRKYDHATFGMTMRGVLIDHAIELHDRRQEKKDGIWPDESDIYDRTICRLKVLVQKELRNQGWTPPEGDHSLAPGE